MIKVFLVEDEIIIRNGIKNCINWEAEGLMFAGEAGDGELAYPLIKKTQPDILITDIRMPFMDGLELSRIVKNELPNIKIIILSGFGEFEYAKEAIKIGVTNYLLKPISSEKLLESIREIAEIIKNEKEQEKLILQLQKDVQQSRHTEEEALYQSIVLGSLSASEILEKAQKLNIELNALNYCVLMFNIISDDYDDDAITIRQAQIKIKKYLTLATHVMSFSWGIEGYVIILEGESEMQIQALKNTCVNELIAIISQFDEIHYFGAYGRIVLRIGDIPKSYNDAARAFTRRFFLSANQIIGFEHTEKTSETSEKSIDLNEMFNTKAAHDCFRQFIKNGTLDEIDTFIDAFFENIGEKNYNSFMYRQYLIIDILVEISEFLKSLNLSFSDLSLTDVKVEQAALTPIPELKNYLKQALTQTLRLRDKQVDTKYGALIDEAKRYINEHFQEDEVSLNIVATAVGVSPNYFSTLFRQEADISFSEYLTKTRIDKAKELLRCTNLRASEVGFQVGYKDSHYFSYIFKKITNTTPKEYRMRGRQNTSK